MKSQKKTNRPNEEKAKATLEQMWLTYINNKLLADGAISPKEHLQMAAKIRTRYNNQISQL